MGIHAKQQESILFRYIGTTNFAPGEWAGVELDQPLGKNDGSVGGDRYFTCTQNHGVFSRYLPAYCMSKK